MISGGELSTATAPQRRAGSLISSLPGRKRAHLVIVSSLLVLTVGISAALWVYGRYNTRLSLHAETIAVGPGGSLVAVPAGAAAGGVLPGTRVLAGMADAPRYVAEQKRWLREGSIPSVPELGASTMVRDALLDLHVLTGQYGVTVAGWTPQWRYVWPRDSAYVASAFAKTGHFSEARRIIRFLQEVQTEDGLLQARYLPDGSGVPDGRGLQTDGLGWALWGTWQVAEALPTAQRRQFVLENRRLLDRSARASATLIENERSLPPPSSDYREVKERKLTLATASMLLAGLSSARQLYLLLGDSTRAAETGSSAARLEAAIVRNFGPDGYPRHLGGSPGSVDLGVSFLLPPFIPAADPDILAVWRRSTDSTRRPAGGLAPGGSWPSDGVSWTTFTSSYALTSAFVDDRAATIHWLKWLDEHRTAAGSIPEKVLGDGQPASVAPLAWSAAAVILASNELSQH